MRNNDTKTIMSNIGAILLNNIAEGKVYEKWSDDFKLKNTQEMYEKIKIQVKESFPDLMDLPKEDLNALGFKSWDEEMDIVLIPLWAFDLIPDGTELTCIDGNKKIKGKTEIDLDVRFGCIAYGIVPKGGENKKC